MLSRVPGWLRSRLLVDVSCESLDFVNYMAIHEYTKSNGLGGPAHQAAQSTPWRTRVMSSLTYPSLRRTYVLHRIISEPAHDLSHTSLVVPPCY